MELQPSSAQAASVRRKKTQRELFALTLLDSGGAARTQPNRDPGRKQQLSHGKVVAVSGPMEGGSAVALPGINVDALGDELAGRRRVLALD